MQTVNLSKFRFLNRNKVNNFNHFVTVNPSLMPHASAIVLGCSVEDATSILLYLYGKELADGYILVYHKSHLDNYFEKRKIEEGFLLKKDFICPVCELLHDNQNELFFDVEFRLKNELRFEFIP